MTAAEKKGASVRLVPLEESDAAGILRIFNHYVVDGFAAYPDEPVSEAFIADLLRSTAGYPALAAKAADGGLLGFGFLRPYSPASAFTQTAVSTIFLDPESTGRGVGAAMLVRLEDEARRKGIRRILVHISSRNPRSIAFHGKHGFTECGRLPGIGRKWNEAFDVVWMVKSLE